MMAEVRNLHRLFHPFKLPATWTVGLHRSPPLSLYGLNFNILFRFKNEEEGKGPKRIVGILLECVQGVGSLPGSTSWSCSLWESRIRVIGKAASDTVERHCSSFTYTDNRKTWGTVGFLDWTDLVGTKFMQEDEHVHIEILFKVDPPVGLDYTGEKLESAGKAHIATDFLALYESGEGSDVVLKSRDGHQFLCHKLILTARSPVFKAMFLNDWKEKEEGVVTVDMEGNSLSLFCNYLYSGSLGGTDKDVEKQKDLATWKELVKGGDMYELSHLSKLAAHAMVLRRTPGNALDILNFLKQFGKEKLADALKTMKQFVIHNVKDIVDENE